MIFDTLTWAGFLTAVVSAVIVLTLHIKRQVF
jgi:hypothetical protein